MFKVTDKGVILNPCEIIEKKLTQLENGKRSSSLSLKRERSIQLLLQQKNTSNPYDIEVQTFFR
jgi:hypothetical protein